MKIIFTNFYCIVFFGCSNINNVVKNPPSLDLIVKQDKYSLILKHYFYKNFKNYDKNLAEFIVETNLSFNTTNALSISGNSNLNIIKRDC